MPTDEDLNNPLVPIAGDEGEDAEYNALIPDHAAIDISALEAALATTGAGEADLGGGLRLETPGPRSRGLIVFKEQKLVQSLCSLNAGELRRISRHLSR